MNQKNLKNKVYKLLFDNITKVDFEKDIQVLVDVYGVDSDSLLHDLTLVNYNEQDYKKRLIEVISKYTTKEELISLKIYQDCINIVSTTDQKIAFSYATSLAKTYIDSENKYHIVYDFHKLKEELSYIKDDLVKTKEEDVYFNIKKCARAVVEKYNLYKQHQKWTDFLQTSLQIIKHKEPIKSKQREVIINQAINELANLESKSKVKRFLKENGFTDHEIKEIMKASEVASKKVMKKKLLPTLIIGIILTTYSIVILSNENNTRYYGFFTLLIGIGLLISTGVMFLKIKKKK
ncbi:hypothetical protein [Kordia sp.]|uniref:hypothetical protein n=1 Tax=Kordia sp. TaxID=1965332 RepID=UPI003D299AA7